MSKEKHCSCFFFTENNELKQWSHQQHAACCQGSLSSTFKALLRRLVKIRVYESARETAALARTRVRQQVKRPAAKKYYITWDPDGRAFARQYAWYTTVILTWCCSVGFRQRIRVESSFPKPRFEPWEHPWPMCPPFFTFCKALSLAEFHGKIVYNTQPRFRKGRRKKLQVGERAARIAPTIKCPVDDKALRNYFQILDGRADGEQWRASIMSAYWRFQCFQRVRRA